jgi:hypothetical protein
VNTGAWIGAVVIAIALSFSAGVAVTTREINRLPTTYITADPGPDVMTAPAPRRAYRDEVEL